MYWQVLRDSTLSPQTRLLHPFPLSNCLGDVSPHRTYVFLRSSLIGSIVYLLPLKCGLTETADWLVSSFPHPQPVPCSHKSFWHRARPPGVPTTGLCQHRLHLIAVSESNRSFSYLSGAMRGKNTGSRHLRLSREGLWTLAFCSVPLSPIVKHSFPGAA